MGQNLFSIYKHSIFKINLTSPVKLTSTQPISSIFAIHQIQFQIWMIF